MQLKFTQALLVSALMVSSTGCGYLGGVKNVFRDRSEDYKAAPEVPPVTIPAGMDSVTLREIYVIPQIGDDYQQQGKFDVPRPEPLSGGEGSEVVRIQKLGDDSWILIGVAPGQVWPQVRNFMSTTGMQVAYADAKTGIMDSNWVKLEGQSLASRFQFRMEQGVQRGTTELYVLQQTQQAGNVEQWPAKSDDPEQSTSMMKSVAQFMADSAESAPVSMIAEQGISAGGKITQQEAADGDTYLRLELPFDRAWASLGRALEKSSFEITDKDRSSGVYYVRYIGVAAAEKQGWWASLWSNDDAQPLIGQVFVVSMQTLPEQAVTIRLRPQDDDLSFGKREEQELLTMIKGHID
ncbi:MAG TPA: outer membrane protein assembly factor BamC [Halioglobus sp.]